MSSRVRTLAARRAALIAGAQQQRATLQLVAAEVQRHLAFADRAYALVERIKRWPVLPGLIAAALTVFALRPKRALNLIGYAATAYSLARRIRSLLRRRQPQA